MDRTWRILVVDDDVDVHAVTQLALKHKSWQHKGFEITSVHSAAEARKLLAASETPRFDVALIDVVMETDQAGLELCDYVRANCSPSLRIVLRTGQPGVAPEERVLNDYDIDYYLSKPEATENRLYAAIRASLRSSQDISTLLVIDEQLKGLTRTIRRAATVSELRQVMAKSLRFLNGKYGCQALFFADIDMGVESACPELSPTDTNNSIDYDSVHDALLQVHEKGLNLREIHAGKKFGLSERAFVKCMRVMEGAGEIVAIDDAPSPAPQASQSGLLGKLGLKGSKPAATPAAADKDKAQAGSGPRAVRGGLFVEFDSDKFNDKTRDSAFRDLERFVENWQIAYSVLCLLDDSAHARWNQPSVGAAKAAAPAAGADAKRKARELWTVGVNAAQSKRYEQAVTSFMQAIEHDPDMSQAHRSLGQALTKLGQQGKAVEYFRKYLKLTPDAEDRNEISRIIDDWEAEHGQQRFR